MTTASSIVGQFSTAEFLRDYFQKKHLFLEGALPDVASVLSSDELAGLACEDGIESRLIVDTRDRDSTGKRVASPYRLRHGPFDEDVFSELGEEAWTLLVQDVDKFVPEVAELLRLVEFLPRWSIDDIMISYAAPGGTVGPHTDRYDVFLLQVEGERRWQVSTKFDESKLRKDTELRVLSHFEAEEEYLARPGDVLYLPSGVAHYGVAETECLTYSFGFRAPTEGDVLSAISNELVLAAGNAQLRESVLQPPAHPAELSSKFMGDARAMIRKRFEALMEEERALGRFLSVPKPHVTAEPSEDEWTPARLEQRLGRGAFLERSIKSRFLFAQDGEAVILYVDGSDFELGSGEAARSLAVLLCEGSPIHLGAQGVNSQEVGQVLVELVHRGALLVVD